MFECPALREQTVEKHEKALQGEPVSFFVESEDHIYWTKLVPRKNEDNNIIGVVGISWDVTNNAIMIHCLEEIITMLKNKEGHDDILPLAQRGLRASRLKRMLDSEAENG